MKKLLIETVTHDILTIVKKYHPEYIVNQETEVALTRYLTDSHLELTKLHLSELVIAHRDELKEIE